MRATWRALQIDPKREPRRVAPGRPGCRHRLLVQVAACLAADLCGARTAGVDAFLRAAARAWGCAGLLRALPFWTARGRALTLESELQPDVLLRMKAANAVQDMWRADREIPSALFPAYGYAALTHLYLNNEKVALLRRQRLQQRISCRPRRGHRACHP